MRCPPRVCGDSMAARRLEYLLLLACAGIYYIASGEWIAWILLLTVAGLPWVSLLVSLPAIISFRISPPGMDALMPGEKTELFLPGKCAFPMPPFRSRIRMQSIFTGEISHYEQGAEFLSTHCGGYRISAEKAKTYDYLGLFSFRVRKTGEQILLVRPQSCPAEDIQLPKRVEINSWRPKPGGGYSENHEHRPYRPGDSLNQLHWKLSAKVGSFIVREPMEPIQGALLLTLELRGTPQEMDRKLGRLRYIGESLLGKNLNFEIHVLTGRGEMTCAVNSEYSLGKAIDELLCTPPAKKADFFCHAPEAAWQYCIGGDPD